MDGPVVYESLPSLQYEDAVRWFINQVKWPRYVVVQPIKLPIAVQTPAQNRPKKSKLTSYYPEDKYINHKTKVLILFPPRSTTRLLNN